MGIVDYCVLGVRLTLLGRLTKYGRGNTSGFASMRQAQLFQCAVRCPPALTGSSAADQAQVELRVQ